MNLSHQFSESTNKVNERNDKSSSTKRLDVKEDIAEESNYIVNCNHVENVNHSTKEATYYNIFRYNFSFRLFLLSYSTTAAGEWLNYISSINVVESLVPNSYFAISILVLVRLTPNILSIFGGAIADSCDKRKIMINLNLLSSMTAILFIVAYRFKSLMTLYIVTFAKQGFLALYEPIHMSYIPLLVEDDGHLQKATTLISLVEEVIAAFGAAVGGVITACVGVQPCFALDSVAYLTGALLLCPIGIVQEPSVESMRENFNYSPTKIIDYISGAWSQSKYMTKEGIQYIGSSFFGPLVFVKSAGSFIYGSANVLNVSFSKTNEQRSSSVRLGILFSCVGFGCFIGPVVSEQLTSMKNLHSLQKAILVSFAFMAISMFCMGYFDESFAMTCVFTILRASGSSTLWINSSILIQKFSSNSMLGRVSAIDYTSATLCKAMSAMLAGILQDYFALSPKYVCYIMSLISWVIFFSWVFFDRNGGGAAHDLASLYSDTIKSQDEYISLL